MLQAQLFLRIVLAPFEPHIPNGSMYVNRSGKPEQLRALAMSLSAVVGSHGIAPCNADARHISVYPK